MTKRNSRCKRDTYLYELRDKGKCVYRGVSKNVDRRIKEHERSGKRFTTIWVSNVPTCRKTALRDEKVGIEIYRRNQGRRPRHNKML
jgi:predicted GIY-YIG superfamily endonuclease